MEETSPEGILKLKFKTDLGLGARANIGMIVLSSDQTLELECRTLLNFEGVALYHARIPNKIEITEGTLAKMEAELPITASLLPASFNFDVIGYQNIFQIQLDASKHKFGHLHFNQIQFG